MRKREILRIVDANLNRSREGLRVCEEITRFVLADKKITEDLKKIRHAISHTLHALPVKLSELVEARDTRRDVAKAPHALENKKKDALDLFLANAERVKEALRALEEFLKLLDPALSKRFKRYRFSFYAIEKRVLPKLETVRHHRR